MRRLTPLFVFAAVALHGQQVTFKDPALESVVRKYVPDHDPKAPLTAARVSQILLVSADSGQTVHDLSGLEACTKLAFYICRTHRSPIFRRR